VKPRLKLIDRIKWSKRA